MSISLTERAANQIKVQIEKRGKGLGLRLGVKKSGCSGFAYVIDYADEIAEDDAVFQERGVQVVIKAKDLDYLKGLELDYAKEGINRAFLFKNPNVKGSCGCGESFTV